MNKLFGAAAGVFAVIPGLSALLNGLGVPPQEHLSAIFGALSEAVGVMLLLILYLSRERLKACSNSTIRTSSAVSAAIGIVLVVLYINLLSYCVVTSGPRNAVYAPLWLPAATEADVRAHGGRRSTLEAYGSAQFEDELRSGTALAFAVTTVVFLILYLSIVAFFTTAFGLLGFKLRDEL